MLKLNLSGRRLPYEVRKSRNGFLFVLPWLIGLIYFFLVPFGKAILFSLGNVTASENGLSVHIVGFDNYVKAFTTDTSFIQYLTYSFPAMLVQIPMILVFSICLALVLNSKFRGRTIIRGLFFLPVIIASGIIINILNVDTVANSMMSGEKGGALFQSIEFGQLILKMGVPLKAAELIMSAINSIFQLVWKSGVQVLLLIAGLQSVSKTVYEASAIDGATAWEVFWKITFPMASPVISLCAFYTVLDASTDYSNQVVRYIRSVASQTQISYSAVLSIIWCMIILLFIAIVFALTKKFVFYDD